MFGKALGNFQTGVFILMAIVCIGISTCVAFAEDNRAKGGTIRGQVLERGKHIPIEGVEVKIVSQDNSVFTVKTDNTGYYKCSNLPTGRYTITFYKDGYLEKTDNPVRIVSVNGGDHIIGLKATNVVPIFDKIIEPLLLHISKSVSKRYNLDDTVAFLLHQSILESIKITLKHDSNMGAIILNAPNRVNMEILEVLLAHPDCKAAFAKYLTEAQLQDYINFTKSRWQRDQQTVAHQITMLIDQELSLTVDQRKKVTQLLLDIASNKSWLISMDILRIDSLELVNLIHYKLKISLDGMLSPMQSQIWKSLVIHNARKKIFRRKTEDKGTESQEWIKQLVEAKLAAHTEQLGHLNTYASKRLALVTNGLIQQYLAIQWDKREIDKKTFNLWNSGVINHPLYQQTIKDVLSEDAYTHYTACQTERHTFYQQTRCDMAIAVIDTQLLLDDKQRKQLKTAVAQLGPLSLTKGPRAYMFYLLHLLHRVDRKGLSTWQINEMERLRVLFESEVIPRLNKRLLP